MATVVNNPAPQGDSGMGFLLGIILIIGVVFVVWRWGLPAMRGAASNSGTQIIVPEKIDVNINKTE